MTAGGIGCPFSFLIVYTRIGTSSPAQKSMARASRILDARLDMSPGLKYIIPVIAR
jgi:hypothetical protein